jgi:SAM-dependent methyltransferase
VIGLTDGDGKIRASMRGKYDQVNEFLKVVGETVSVPAKLDFPFTVVDCGCGKAYLTIALWYYLTEVMKIPEARVVGIDRRADVVAAARKMSAQLDLSGKVDFIEADLSSLAELPSESKRVDMVVSLHACDTATDEALAKGVEWKARYILSAPCCQHELQKAIGPNSSREFAGLLRHGILRERLCDLLTDSFRAMILRILGFKVQVIEFVSSEATARNVMLKCEYAVKPGQPGPVGEYLELRDYWKVVPWLETRLSPLLSRHLSRFA